MSGIKSLIGFAKCPGDKLAILYSGAKCTGGGGGGHVTAGDRLLRDRDTLLL